MKIEKEDFVTQRTARVYRLKACTEQTKGIIFAVHGYRQLGYYFLRKFQPLAELGYEVIAPEGLNRFYIEGYSGRVGASWMTKEERETDIKDYLAYLNGLLSQVRNEWPDLPFHLIGFSQGGATASRWLASNDFPWKSFLLYASVFPNDFDFEGQQVRLKTIPSLMAFGDSDQFANEETIQQKMDWLASKGIQPELHRFAGGHDVYKTVLIDIAKKLNW